MSDDPEPGTPWWVTSLIAAAAVMILSGLALYLPPSRATVVLVIGAVTFLVLLRHNPAYWRRRLAGVCVGAAVTLALTPTFKAYLNFGSVGYLLVDGGSAVVLAAVFLVGGVAFAWLESLAHRKDGVRSLRAGRDIQLGERNETHYHGPVNVTVGGEATRADQSRPLPQLVERYLDWLALQPMRLHLRGVGGGDFNLDLGEIYVPLSLTRSLHGDDLKRRRGAPGSDDGSDFEISALFARLDGRRHALILGDAGSGKSTALRKLTQLAVRQASRAVGRSVPDAEGKDADLVLGSLHERVLPIFVRLRTFTPDDRNRTLEAFVARELVDISKRSDTPLDVTVTGALWRHRKLLLLLDGLDEIVDPALRAEFCRFLSSQLATDRCKSFAVVVTCRYKGYESLKAELLTSFARVELRPLSAEQAHTLVQRWFVEAGKALKLPASQARAYAENLVNGLKDPRFASHRRSMYATPLVLTLLCVVVQRGHSIPANRAEFYETCLRVLLESYPKAKHDDPEAAEPAIARCPLPVKDAIELLRPIAHTIHSSDDDRDPTRREQMGRDEPVMHIGDGLRELGHGQLRRQDVFTWLHECADILDELAPGHFGFFHLGVQEYLTALHIATVGGAEIDALAGRFGESWWVEVMLLAASLPRLGVFRQLMPRLLDTADLSDPKQWQTLRECVLEAAFDPEPFITRFTGEVLPPPGRLLAMLRMLDGIEHPALARAARELARADVSVEVRGAATQLAEAIDRVEPVAGSTQYDVAVIGLGVDLRAVERLLTALRLESLRVWPPAGAPPPLAELSWEQVADHVASVLLMVESVSPWSSAEHRSALAKLRNLGDARPLAVVLAPGARASLDGAPREIQATFEVAEDWDLSAIVEHVRPVPGRSSVERPAVGSPAAAAQAVLVERVKTPTVEPITGLRLLYVPGGTFMMGSDDLHDDSKPPHRVRVRPFWIGETPVTNRQYGVFLERAKHPEPRFWRDRRFNDPSQPVVGVSWDDAFAFCRWLTTTSGWSFDLPSEAQWEFAARGEDNRPYPWGWEKPDATRACFAQGESGRSAVVGSYPAGMGPFGTLDQAGNVWEWCKDVWDPKVYRERAKTRGEVVDPIATTGPNHGHRSLRGGSWYNDKGSSRVALAAASRHRSWHGFFVDVISGFRVVVSREPVDS